MPAPASIRIEGLSHRYPGADRFALSDVSVQLQPGMRLGLLGPNGAGKSTLMRILCGYLPVQSHKSKPPRIEVGGHDVITDSLAVRAQVGYMPEQVPLYTELRVREHLGFRARIKRVKRRERDAEIERVAKATGISDKLSTPVGQLSRGYRQRVGIADALLGSPPLLILDEPTVGLDPNQVKDIRQMLRDLGGKQTLVFSSHILAEVEALCDHVVILSLGRVAASETIQEALAAGHVAARWRADRDDAQAVVEAAWTSLELDGDCPRVDAADGEARVRLPLHDVSAEKALGELGRHSAEQGVQLLELAPGRTRLEERFAEVTGAGRADR